MVKISNFHFPHLYPSPLYGHLDFDRPGRKDDYMLDTRFLQDNESTDARELKLAIKNKTISIPQPSEDPLYLLS